MAKIIFSLSGEGRGHATRIRAVVEELRGEHTISVLAPGDAYEFLAPLYSDTEAMPGAGWTLAERHRALSITCGDSPDCFGRLATGLRLNNLTLS